MTIKKVFTNVFFSSNRHNIYFCFISGQDDYEYEDDADYDDEGEYDDDGDYKDDYDEDAEYEDYEDEDCGEDGYCTDDSDEYQTYNDAGGEIVMLCNGSTV